VSFTEARASNGLRIVMAEDHLLPVVGVSVAYQVGSRDDTPGRTGIAHFFEHMMFQGSTNVGKTEHIRRIEEAGGQMNGFTSFEVTVYFEQVPANQLELAHWLESERMGGLLAALNQETLDN